MLLKLSPNFTSKMNRKLLKLTKWHETIFNHFSNKTLPGSTIAFYCLENLRVNNKAEVSYFQDLPNKKPLPESRKHQVKVDISFLKTMLVEQWYHQSITRLMKSLSLFDKPSKILWVLAHLQRNVNQR